MQSKFYQPDEHRAEKVREMFATIARRYDLLNDVMTLGVHRHWKHRLVELAGNPRDVLDLCCGTGDIALRFSGLVIGVDFTEEMLRVAQSRAAGHWVRADALHLPFRDNAFDVVSIGYGLRNLADIECGLREIYRVLRPGGKLLSLDFGKPENQLLRKLYFAHLQFHLPLIGRWSCGDPEAYSYILASLEAYPAQRGVAALMEQIGYRDCGFEEFVGGTMAINFGHKPDGSRSHGKVSSARPRRL
jgi:demethylmenaquinone methyltransferase/2-methoxy-6-polyprenyl-1,4-benzoquinol methylase